jgi:hypothetical protein
MSERKKMQSLNLDYEVAHEVLRSMKSLSNSVVYIIGSWGKCKGQSRPSKTTTSNENKVLKFTPSKNNMCGLYFVLFGNGV